MSTTGLQIIFIFIGLILAFFGLPIYRRGLKVIGFVVGAGYAIYLFLIFANSIQIESIFKYIIALLLILILGSFGMVLTRMANTILFFLAGGLVGLILGKIFQGVPAEKIVELAGSDMVVKLFKPEAKDIFWFLGGGFVFILAIEVLEMLALCALGAGLIWYATQTMQLMKPDWVIPGIIGVLGFIFQENMRQRARKAARIPRQRRPSESRPPEDSNK